VNSIRYVIDEWVSYGIEWTVRLALLEDFTEEQAHARIERMREQEGDASTFHAARLFRLRRLTTVGGVTTEKVINAATEVRESVL
jgi:hypothetical protein